MLDLVLSDFITKNFVILMRVYFAINKKVLLILCYIYLFSVLLHCV
jgi:hypothetical protein